MNKRLIKGYSGYQILLHWAIAAMVLFQLVFGESMTTVVDAAEEGKASSLTDQTLGVAHFWVGMAILCLVIVRIVVRLVQGVPEPNRALGLLTFAARSAHFLFYVLLLAVPITGLLAVYVSDIFSDIHTLGKPAFIVLIVLHATAAFFHQFIIKDSTLRRILVPANSPQN